MGYPLFAGVAYNNSGHSLVITGVFMSATPGSGMLYYNDPLGYVSNTAFVNGVFRYVPVGSSDVYNTPHFFEVTA